MSDSEESYVSDDSEYNFIPGVIPIYNVEVEEEVAEQDDDTASEMNVASINFAGPYTEEPLADEEWLQDYRKKKELEENLRRQLQARIDGTIHVEDWCPCGNCKTEMLQNVYEAKCCREIEKCVEACNTEDVARDVETAPQCIVLHPGFRPICLEKWALKQSASKYKTQDRQKYKQTGSEERFLRAVSYREFCQLVYGYLGGERIPLPACTYHVIRKQFSASEDDEYTGFEENLE